MPVSVEDLASAAAVRGEPVDLKPTAGGVLTVDLVADGFVRAAETGVGVVRQSVAAARVAGH